MTEISPELEQVLRADQGILDAFGMQVERAQDGECAIACRVPAGLINAGGFAHGSIAFALMDTACAYALRSVGVSGVTTNANVTYVKGAAAHAELTCNVAVVSRTRRVATLRGETYLLEEGGAVLAAHGSFVFQLRATT